LLIAAVLSQLAIAGQRTYSTPICHRKLMHLTAYTILHNLTEGIILMR
jgi:hypothetical protein